MFGFGKKPEVVNPLVELSAIEQAKLRKIGAKATYLRGLLPTSLSRAGGRIVAAVLPVLIHEEEVTKRLGAVRLKLGRPVEKERGPGGSPVQTVHSGNELELPVDGFDNDGAKTSLNDLSAVSSDTTQVTTRVGPRVNTPGDGLAVFIADALGGNLTTDGQEPEVTVNAGSGVAVVERVRVIANDTTGLQLGAAFEGPRPTGEPGTGDQPTPNP